MLFYVIIFKTNFKSYWKEKYVQKTTRFVFEDQKETEGVEEDVGRQDPLEYVALEGHQDK